MLAYPDIDPVLLEVGPLAIRWYSLSYLAGILLGFWYLLRLDRGTPPVMNQTVRDDLMLWAIIGIVLGGRIGYVLFYNLPFYASDPLQALKIWQGGMSFHGGMLGFIFAMWVLCKRQGVSYWRLMDRLACVAPIGLCLGRLANFINGELYGRVTDVPWAMIFPHDPDGLPRHPSQLYQAALEGALLFVCLSLAFHYTKLKDTPGRLSGLFLIGYGVFRAFAEFFREPDMQLGFLAGGLTMGQLLCIPMLGYGAYLYARRNN